MRLGKKVILVAGLQNLWQVGLVFPLNVAATAYFAVRARFRAATTLDRLVLLYIGAGVVSLVTGMGLAFRDDADSALLLNALKSFAVFAGVIVYFGVRGVRVEEFFKVSMWVVALIGVGVLSTYGYLFANDPISLYSSRSAVAWLPGWPQRWVMFPIVGHFVFLCRYDATRKLRHFGLAAILLAITLLSATRSAIVGVLAGHLVLSVLSRRDLLRSLVILALCGIAIGIFYDEFQDALRLNELAQYGDDAYTASSVEYRIQNIWPGIVASLGIARLAFGWGHVGVAYIPHRFFPDTSMMSDVPGDQQGSAEGEYLDVLSRQGFVGLALYLAILVCGVVYAYKLYKSEQSLERRSLWKAALAWQVAIILHGVATETVRFPIYGLFFFLFLGIASNYRLARLLVRQPRATTDSPVAALD